MSKRGSVTNNNQPGSSNRVGKSCDHVYTYLTCNNGPYPQLLCNNVKIVAIVGYFV